MLPASPPTRADARSPLRLGATGWPVYALQCALNDAAGAALDPDGAFGPATLAAVKRAQTAYGAREADGVVGPRTQRELSEAVCRRLERRLPALPDGLPGRVAAVEGGWNLAAVNPDVPGGIDASLFQERAYGPPWTVAELKRVFSPYRSGERVFTALLERAGGFARPHRDCPFTPVQLAILAHNWPWAAARYHRYGRLPNPSKKCGTADVIGYDEAGKPIYGWVPMSLPARTRTYDGWAHHYVGQYDAN